MLSPEFPFRFDSPIHSLLGIILGLLVGLLFYLSHKRLRIAEKHLELVEWRKLRRIVRILNATAKSGIVIALAFLLATPYFSTTVEIPVDEITEEQMADYTATVIVIMDVSFSMNYSDLKPTRFEVSRTMTKLLVNKLSAQDLIGFISFAGQTYDVVFPTTNRTTIIETVDNQTLHRSTAIGTALETAIGMLETYQVGGKAIVLFSDGKNNWGGNVTQAADDAFTQKMPIFAVSLGTYGLYEADPLSLKEISDKTGGRFYEARNEGIDNLVESISEIAHEVKVGALKAIYDKLIIPSKDYQTPRVIFSVLLVAALFLSWFIGV